MVTAQASQQLSPPTHHHHHHTHTNTHFHHHHHTQDMERMLNNCRIYNGRESPYTKAAERVYACFQGALAAGLVHPPSPQPPPRPV